jgi:hypothetical protein
MPPSKHSPTRLRNFCEETYKRITPRLRINLPFGVALRIVPEKVSCEDTAAAENMSPRLIHYSMFGPLKHSRHGVVVYDLDFARTWLRNVILLDLRMSDMSGPDAMRDPHRETLALSTQFRRVIRDSVLKTGYANGSHEKAECRLDVSAFDDALEKCRQHVGPHAR